MDSLAANLDSPSRTPPAKPDSSSVSGSRAIGRLFAPVDIASLAVFRILFGAAMVQEAVRYAMMGWISEYYINPKFCFTYYGFSWVKPWAGNGMYVHFAVMALAALGVLLGAWYRFCAVTLFVTFTYVFLLDQAHYLNHFYLICLLAFMMIVIPAHRALSVDSWRRPSLRSNDAPAWCLWLLLAQVSIVYFYAGIAKLNADWLHGEPMRTWLGDRTHIPLIGQFFEREWMILLFNYGGLAFDLFIVPLLLCKPTRIFGFCWAITFHLLNFVLFNIGIFPWLMIAATLLYFRPDWPRLVFKWSRSGTVSKWPEPRWPGVVVSALAVYLGLQVLVPLRHLLYRGNVHWTEEGHRFSWHMKLRDKNGSARFYVSDPVRGNTWEVHPRLYLTARQTTKMSVRPDMILQFAHFIARDQARRRRISHPLEVRARVTASLHGRPPQLLIDPEVNLAAENRSLRSAKWILPLASQAPP
jgi:vitamin K-dependent gamma-carboxylase